ncbi:MAG: hypothetical protein KGN80_00045 [Acidobacteriota bacterium]|nr:hypothetical protein [Acidobacteriota bacterium]
MYMRVIKDGAQVRYEADTPWTTLTTYKLGDYVSEAGSNYRCIAPHVSGTFATDLTGVSNWRLVPVAAWVTATPYTFGQRVSHGGSYYTCIEDHTSGTFADDLASVVWLLLVTPAWATATKYSVGTYVVEGGFLYVCEVDHTSATFATDKASPGWVLVAVIGDIVEISTPYNANDLALIKYAQSADVITLVHPNYQPMNLGRYAHDDWRLTLTNSDSGPYLSMNIDKGKTVHVSGVSGGVTIYSSMPIFSASNVGQLFYIEQRNYGLPWEPGKVIAKGDIRRSDGKYYEALAAGTTGTLRPTHWTDSWSDGGVEWLYLHMGYGVMRITGTSDDGYTAGAQVVSGKLPDLTALGGVTGDDSLGWVALSAPSYRTAAGKLGLPLAAHGLGAAGTKGLCMIQYPRPSYQDYRAGRETYNYKVLDADHVELDRSVAISWVPPVNFFKNLTGLATSTATNTYRWQFGAWGGAQGWPSVVTYHQGRRTFAATPLQPHTIWGSRVDSYDDFSTSVPVQDDDAITWTLASSQVDGVRGLLSMDKLMLLTAGANWAAGSGDPLTPGNIPVRIQGFRGSSHVQPMGVGNSVVYIQDKNQIIRDLAYDFASDRYDGDDLTVFAAHLTENRTIVEWAYQQHPFGIIWSVRDDGALLGLTYMREEKVVGWHWHDTNGCFESVCCVSEGQEDAVYVIVYRKINNVVKRYIERFNTRLITNIEDAFFVDCGLTYDGRNTAGITTCTLTGGTTWDVEDSLTATFSTAVWSGSSDIGDQIVMKDADGETVYRFTVTAYTSPTVVTVRPNRNIPAGYQAVARTDWSIARDTLSGLDHLEGKYVSVLSDGFVEARAAVQGETEQNGLLVSGGIITLSQPGSVVQVGLPIIGDLKTLSVSVLGQENVVDKKKAIPAVRAQLLESRSFFVGRDVNHLWEAKERSTEAYALPIRLQDGVVSIFISTPWSPDGSICVRQLNPLPLTITSIIPEVHVGGN